MQDGIQPRLTEEERMVLDFVWRFGPAGHLLPMGNAAAERLGRMALLVRHGSGWLVTERGRHYL